jgi:hypothetical protein
MVAACDATETLFWAILLVPRPDRSREPRTTAYGPGELPGLYTTMPEVIDPVAAGVVARVMIPGFVHGFARDGIVFSHREDASGDVVYDLWKGRADQILAGRSMMRTQRIALKTGAVLALTLFATGTLHAQTVRGVVLEDTTEKRIQDAAVSLIGEMKDDVLAKTIAGDGVFLVRAPEAGRYRLRVERIGYRTTVTEVISLEAATERHVKVRMGVEAVPLEPLIVEAETTPEPPFLADIRRRAAMGFGKFVMREQLDQRAHEMVFGILGGVGGVRVGTTRFGDMFVRMASVTTARSLNSRPVTAQDEFFNHNPCPPALYLNGGPIWQPRIRTPGIPGDEAPLGMIRTYLEERAGDVETIEVYRGPAEVPAEYGGTAARCGVIAVWLRR